jgi:ABC-type spermidine/putrescine transport system permease subunit I
VARLPGIAAVRPLLPCLPLLLFLLALLGYPVGRVLVTGLAGDAGGAALRELATAPLYRDVLLRTLRISATVTLACLLLGYPVAYTLATAPRRLAMPLLVLVVVPFWVSLLARSFTWLVLLQRNGVVNQLLRAAGLSREPVPLVYNELGVHVGMAHILLPYMILMLYGVMRGVEPGLLRAAANLGASDWQAFRRVVLPLTLPGVAAGSLLLFVLGLGFFITPALLGGGKVTMVAVLIEASVRETLDWPLAAALSAALLLATALVVLPAARVLRPERLLGAAP